jgi:hypothetical protein
MVKAKGGNGGVARIGVTSMCWRVVWVASDGKRRIALRDGDVKRLKDEADASLRPLALAEMK